MSIVIGLDIGSKRTGIAKSDAMGIIIKPFKTVGTAELISELKKIEDEFGIEKFVIGEPHNIQEGNKDAYNFVMKTKSQIETKFPKTPISMIDERFTSKEAQEAIKEQGTKLSKDNKGLIDSYAAAIILEQYFNFHS